ARSPAATRRSPSICAPIPPSAAGLRTCAPCSHAGCRTSCARTAATSPWRSAALAAAIARSIWPSASPTPSAASGRPWYAIAASRACRNDRAVGDLPLFPLNTVLFPGGRLPLRIFEQRYMDMAKACLKDSSPFGVCLIREGTEVGDPAVPAEVGTLAKLTTWDMPQLGVLHVLALG